MARMAKVNDVVLIGAELARIAEQNDGLLLPERVVAEAEAPDSLLHDRFEWNDKVAGYEHRLNQARTLIRSVRVVRTVDNHLISTVAYVHDPTGRPTDAGYLSIDTVGEQPDHIRTAMEAEFKRLRSLVERTREMGEAWGIADAVEAELKALLD